MRSEAGTVGVDYPVAVDNNYGTWDAYSNQYWPAEYLIDPSGEVRAYDFGEGGYGAMESNIRQLLTANGATNLPAPSDVADKTPTNQITQETYLGYSESNPQLWGRRSTSARPSTTTLPVHSAQRPRLQRDVDRPFATSDRRRQCRCPCTSRRQRLLVLGERDGRRLL
jgi:hypothetical protein